MPFLDLRFPLQRKPPENLAQLTPQLLNPTSCADILE
jgi:hypothetical protein